MRTTDMVNQRETLDFYLGLEYPYTVVPDDGSYFIEYPDLPGCMTQVEEAQEIPEAAEEIRALWIEGEFEEGKSIPEPVTKEYSGKFVMRVPKSLHKELVESAKSEGMSLNAYANYLLAERHAVASLKGEIASLKQQMTSTVDQRSHIDRRRGSENDRRAMLRIVDSSETVAV